jgi:hypothetical protein
MIAPSVTGESVSRFGGGDLGGEGGSILQLPRKGAGDGGGTAYQKGAGGEGGGGECGGEDGG